MSHDTHRRDFFKTLRNLVLLLVLSGLALLGLRACQDEHAPIAAPAKTNPTATTH